MKSEKLRELWSGVPVDPWRDFAGLEARLQCTFPNDYKQLHGMFGVGAFGQACLFHPKRTPELVRLPDAALIIREMMTDPGNDESQVSLGRSSIALASLMTRIDLLWHMVEQRWVIWDAEYESQTFIEEGVVEFLYTGYQWSQGGQSSAAKYRVWESMWLPGDPFFRPAIPGRY